MAKEVKALQLLGRSDKQGQFWLAPQPKYCPLPFLLYLLPVPSPSSTTERTVLHCTARTLLRDFSLLAVKKEHSCFCWPLFTLSVCVSPFLLLYHCWNTFAHTQQPLLGAAVALGRVLPHWLPSSGKRSPRTVLSNSCWQALRGSRPPSPGGHHKPPCPHAGNTPNDGKEQNLSLGNSQASKSGRDLKHKRYWWKKGQGGEKVLTRSNLFWGILIHSFWVLSDRWAEHWGIL